MPEVHTKDKDYDLVTVAHLCMEHEWRLDKYAEDARKDGDQELESLFNRMKEHSIRGAEEAKKMLSKRLMNGSS